MRHTCRIGTPLGEMIALVEDDALAGLWFVGQKYAPGGCEAWPREESHPVLLKVREQLAAYFAGTLTAFDLPLALHGTPFQVAVWGLLRRIPIGERTSYGNLSRQICAGRDGARSAAQAVGSAIGRNPICIVIPCHRVVGSDGSLTGYAGGLERKAALLALEARILT